MAKANRKAIDSSNFWDGHWVHGRYTAKPKVNAGDIRRSQKAKKDRLRSERQIKNYFKHFFYADRNQNRDKQQKKHDQIQYGFDLANWWNELHA